MDIAGTAAVVLVVIWLLLTLAYQYKPIGRKMGRFDFCRLLPSWTFFAPSPATRDYHLLIRDQLSNGELSDWCEVTMAQPRGKFDGIWHPAKRRRKILSDAAQSIKLLNRETESSVVQHSLPYLLILHYCVTQHARSASSEARQFAFVETSGIKDRKLWVTFISKFHPL